MVKHCKILQWNKGFVYTDTVSNQLGFMTLTLHQKRHSFKIVTRNLSNHFPSVLECGCLRKRCTPCEVHHVYSWQTSLFCAQTVTVFKSMRIHHLPDQWRQFIILKTLHFLQPCKQKVQSHQSLVSPSCLKVQIKSSKNWPFSEGMCSFCGERWHHLSSNGYWLLFTCA